MIRQFCRLRCSHTHTVINLFFKRETFSSYNFFIEKKKEMIFFFHYLIITIIEIYIFYRVSKRIEHYYHVIVLVFRTLLTPPLHVLLLLIGLENYIEYWYQFDDKIL